LVVGDEVAEFAKDGSYYMGPQFVEYVRQGRLLFYAALAGERLAAYGCYTVGAVPEDQAGGASMGLPADVAYMSNGFTHPDFRGARLHGLLMGLALKELGQRGVTKLASLVSWSNVASLKSCDRLGYERLGRMVVFGGMRRVVGFYPRRAKALGILFGRAGRAAELRGAR
jgi:GNAT superfamily N-acetyltransferase